MILSSLGKHKDIGLLILRVVVGLAFMMHGYPKVTGGLEMWTGLGAAMNVFGINFGAPFWGALAAFTEFPGGLVLSAGLHPVVIYHAGSRAHPLPGWRWLCRLFPCAENVWNFHRLAFYRAGEI